MKYLITLTFLILTALGTGAVTFGVILNGLSLYLATEKTEFGYCLYHSMRVTGEALFSIALSHIGKAKP